MVFLPDTNPWISLLKNPGGKLEDKVRSRPVPDIFLCAVKRHLRSLDQPVKLLCSGDGVGHRVQAGDYDWGGGIGAPNRGSQVGGGLQDVAGVIEPGDIGRPRQNDVVSGKGDCQ